MNSFFRFCDNVMISMICYKLKQIFVVMETSHATGFLSCERFLMFCSFIVSILNTAPDPEKDCDAVQDFFYKMESAFRAHPLWSGCSDDELDNAGDVSYSSSLFPAYLSHDLSIIIFLDLIYVYTGPGEVCHDKVISPGFCIKHRGCYIR